MPELIETPEILNYSFLEDIGKIASEYQTRFDWFEGVALVGGITKSPLKKLISYEISGRNDYTDTEFIRDLDIISVVNLPNNRKWTIHHITSELSLEISRILYESNTSNTPILLCNKYNPTHLLNLSCMDNAQDLTLTMARLLSARVLDYLGYANLEEHIYQMKERIIQYSMNLENRQLEGFEHQIKLTMEELTRCKKEYFQYSGAEGKKEFDAVLYNRVLEYRKAQIESMVIF